MLEEFAARQGFTNIVHFTDDGISGTCFDRPGFLAMMKEVKAGNVEYLCIKDMSRMGRDYLKVGQIMEILRQRGVRLIAINDDIVFGVESIDQRHYIEGIKHTFLYKVYRLAEIELGA